MGKEPAQRWNSDAYKKELQETARKPGKVVRESQRGEAFSKAGKSSRRVLRRRCWRMRRWNRRGLRCIAMEEWKSGAVTGSTGSAECDRAGRGLEEGRRDVNVTLLGGGFGRKSFPTS